MAQVEEIKEQDDKLYTSNELTNIEKWYDNIAEYTFETTFIELTLEEAKAIQFAYEYYSSFKRYEMETNGEEKGVGVNLYYDDENYKDKFGESFDWKLAFNSNLNNDKDGDEYKTHLKHLGDLSNKINNVINEMECDQGIFVKLSRRAPKDSANESLKMFEIMTDELSKKCDGDFKNVSNAQVVESYFYASIKSLCVYNGDEAIELLSTSYRIWKDLTQSMLKQSRFNVSVIIRKWYKDINPLWEFRLFIRDQKPTGLTQYNPWIYSKRMYESKLEIENLILSKYKKIQPLIAKELKYFTIDFAIMINEHEIKDALTENDIIAIEINPGPPVAGTALFIWENKDDQLILSGDKPFETRIHKSLDDVANLDDLGQILPDFVIYYVELLKGNKPKKRALNTELNQNVFDHANVTGSVENGQEEQKPNFFEEYCILL